MELSGTNNISNDSLAKEPAIIGFATCDGTFFFNYGQIIRCDAKSNYTRFHFIDRKMLIVAKTLGDYENSLPSQFFLRIHRSDIINISHIRKQDNHGNMWLSDGTRLTVSKRRKARVTKALQSYIL
jgi:two-component system, LytTR family, response regulator